jgi:thiol-disulfide isomerase/thioredoxin
MELFNFYNLDECLDLKKVKKRLTQLEKEGKIEYSHDSDILKIEDLDLDEDEVSELLDLFEDNDIFAYPDYQEDGDGYDNYDEYGDEEEDY